MIRWPFVGRDEERAALGAAARTGGALLTGPPGVGKSALAACLHGLRLSGTGSAVPLGAFAHLLPAGPPAANLFAWAAERLGPRPLLIADDAHLLDETSAALLHHLATRERSERATVIAVTRSGADLPAPLRALGLPRLELSPLRQEHAGRLLTAALGDRVDGETVRTFWRAAAGNLRFLRELVSAAVAAGALALVDGVWCSRGGLPLSLSLRELVSAEIGDLDEEERDVLELVAVHESVDAGILLAGDHPDAVHRVERRGLITTRPRGGALLVRLAHPMYQAVIREWVGPLRARHHIHRLAPGDTPVTGREQQVGQLASWGLTNREIADWLGLSHRTVGNHLHRLYAKVGVNDRTHLAGVLNLLNGLSADMPPGVSAFPR
ncbi:hypothetical protein Aph01nite_26090 [Acrocarpospora phusangensis]|uniref:HTH luxR-type domain-containing protein n=1 Tax=Acrocarpospora phusangensis TaxID=1070424 RepID=A0A919Q8A0_9ACTN|nr:LuxR C-terminal-related transcriptional regulator [Acrocarpospora phusangensis]GIH24299.1 hypothetical protein Aph01nite_26090 [Acrocarpospora phusangensis]